MRCPFLFESTASFCDARPSLLLPPGAQIAGETSPCRGGDERACPFVERGELEALEHDERGCCTRLSQRRVLACDAAPRREYLPYVQGLSSRCQSDAFRYCPLYLARETPRARLRGHSVEVQDVIVATDRSYSPHHLWVDEGELGTCTLGVDDFVRFVLPRLDEVHFMTHASLERPRVVLVGGDVYLDLEFPCRMEILATNVHVRREPAVVLRDPYGAGWLLEARELGARHATVGLPGMVSGESAPAWMARELSRLDEFAQAHALRDTHDLGPTANDGGRCACGILGRLDPLGRVGLHRSFFQCDHEERQS